MCDVNLDKLEAEKEMLPKSKQRDMAHCMKCKIEKPVVIIRVNDPMCRECFLQYATHKFRSTLGKSKLIKANDKVLLAVSGGHSSTAMTHLVKEALSEGAHKRLKFSPGIVFIDESVTIKEQVEQQIQNLKEEIDKYGYPFYKMPIYKTSDTSDENVAKVAFQKGFEAITTLTAKTDFVEKIRLQLIMQTAILNGYNKIMIGENATTLAMKLLCNVSQGRGISLSKDIAVGDDRYNDVMIVRPMREISSKEVAMYNRFNGLQCQTIPNLNTMTGMGSSLQRQTEEFINGLQAEFPSTVSTVFRTGDKLCSNDTYDTTEEKCALCQGTISKEELINTPVEKTGCSKEGGCCGSSDECSSNKFKITKEDIKESLCYGCNLTFRDMDYDLSSLPQFLVKSVSTNIKRSKMKETIQDFLLE